VQQPGAYNKELSREMIYGLTYNYACCCFWEIFSLTEFTQFLKYPWQLYPRSPPHASDFSRLNRAFFLGLNSICRRFRFIVQFSFLKTSKSQHFFQQGRNLRCLQSVQNLLSKSFMFFANKIKCVACPGTLLGPQFVYMLRNRNTLYVVTSN
jgi:hypothetical protein